MIPTTIALIADCDDTLAPDTTAQLLEFCGVDPRVLFAESGELVNQGWDPVVGYMRRMVELSKDEGPLATLRQPMIQQLARRLSFYPGVPDFFSRVKEEIENEPAFRAVGIRVESYVVSSGIQELLRASVLGQHTHRIWGCDFAYGASGVIEFPKNVVSHTEKTRFIFMINKGQVSPDYDGQPYAVNAYVREDERPVPFENMIYLGDGPSDIPCMSLLQSKGGYVIGIISESTPAKSWALGVGRRANLTLPGNFEPETITYRNIREAVWQRAQEITRQITGSGPVPRH